MDKKMNFCWKLSAGMRRIAAIVMALLAIGGPLRATTETDSVRLVLSGFSYQSNFWANSFPSATTSGPAPVSEFDIQFVMNFIAPVDRAYDFGHVNLPVSTMQVAITTVDIAGFSRAGDVATRTDFSANISKTGNGAAAVFGLVGTLDLYTQFGGAQLPLVKLRFTVPTFFEPVVSLTGNTASYQYASPKPFDAPRYGVDPAQAGSVIAVRQVLAAQAAPVPLPSGLWLGLGAVGSLIAARRSGRRAA